MGRCRSWGLAVLCSLLLPAVAAHAQGQGSVAGSVKGSADFGEVPAVVYLTGAGLSSVEPEGKRAVMDQKDMTFIPHVMVVEVGTTVEFLNSDSVLHNVFTPSKAGDRFNLGTYPQGVKKEHTFDKPGEVVLLCNVHPEMEAYILVVENAFHATTGSDGTFRIEGVPPGEYTLNVWHPQLRGEARTITITDGSVTEVEFVLR